MNYLRIISNYSNINPLCKNETIIIYKVVLNKDNYLQIMEINYYKKINISSYQCVLIYICIYTKNKLLYYRSKR